jgi:mRNA-degrading endonuclease toxin of MazEF toxin-antitoxin module
MPPANAIRYVELTPEEERQRRISVAQAAEIKGISEDTFRRHFGHLIEKTTPGRATVRLGDVLD